MSETLSEAARGALLVEYEQCAESYRHIYQTIWQTAAFFAAISAAILAFGTNDGPAVLISLTGSRPTGESTREFWLTAIAPIPFFFWYFGIFLTMNHYGELRAMRLAKIEQTLNSGVPGLKMEHFLGYNTEREESEEKKRGKWFPRPRVRHVVTAFCLVVLLLDLTWIGTLFL